MTCIMKEKKKLFILISQTGLKPMKKIMLKILFVLLLASCSTTNLSKNIVQDSFILVKNGTFADKVWKENLVFDRASWYHELTMQLDIMTAHVAPQSAFNFWFSKDELEQMIKCGDARVVLAYT